MTTTSARPAVSTLAAGVAGWSGLMALLGAWWWLQPGRYPFGRDPEGPPTLMNLLPAGAVGPALVAAGVVGVLLALFGNRQAVVTGAALHVAVFALAVPGLAPLTFTGYAMAIFGPWVVFATILFGAWKWRGGPMLVGVFVLLGVVAWMSGFANGAVLSAYFGMLASSSPKLVVPLILMFFLVGGLLWGALGVRAWRGAHAGGAQPSWTRPEAAARWGKVAVIVAVLCALPYGLHRFSWLTPWPIGISLTELLADPTIRLHGFMLGMSSLAGAVLTYGLIAKWGEVWPRWMPVVRGRRVPIAAAVVPGAFVATLFLTASVPFAMMSLESGAWQMLLIFPFPVWGLALGAAVLAYWLRRRGTPREAGTIGGS